MIPIVVYTGADPWNAPRAIREAVRLPDALRHAVPGDDQYHLVEVRRPDIALQDETLRGFFDLLQAVDKLADGKETQENVHHTVAKLGAQSAAVRAVETVIGRSLTKVMEGEEDVYTIVDQAHDAGVRKGKEDGIAIGQAWGIIRVLRDMGQDDRSVVLYLVNRLGITEEQALEYMKDMQEADAKTSIS